MTPAIQTLFNRLSDGLAIVSSDLKVRFANEVMRQMLPLQLGQTFPHVVVADLLEQAHAEHLSLPHSFQTELARSRLMRPLIRGQEAQDSTPGLGLGLPLARSIVEMHQGRLVLDQELDGFVTCTVELPTAISPQAPDELNLALAQRYANDLARLMTTRRSRQQRNTQ